MIKHIKVILVTIVIVIILFFSSFIHDDNSVENTKGTDKNKPPRVKINAPNSAYFNENITFDASESYDIDGEIVNYNWIFQDGEEIQGEIIQRSYLFENTLNIE